MSVQGTSIAEGGGIGDDTARQRRVRADDLERHAVYWCHAMTRFEKKPFLVPAFGVSYCSRASKISEPRCQDAKTPRG